MGSSKNGGLTKVPTKNPNQLSAIDRLLADSGPLLSQAAKGYQQFLPGGSGLNAIETQANQNFQQNTIPNILSSLGADANVKGSSGLNQSLAGAGKDLNTDLAALRSQYGLSAAQGLGGLGLGGQELGIGTDTFGYTKKPRSPLQELLLGGIGNAGGIAQLLKLFI